MLKSKGYKKRAVSASLSSSNGIERLSSDKNKQKKYNKMRTQSNDASTHYIVKGNRSHHNTSAFDNTNSYIKSNTYNHSNSYINKSNERLISKPTQQLLEQNHHLKVQLNDLSSKLHLTRSKIQSQKKKHLLFSKKLNRQFSNQLYWQNHQPNQYLITGIKHQYQKLKASYQQKQQQLQLVKLTISSTNLRQIQSYCESLQIQNKILIQNITYLKKNKKKSNSRNQQYQNYPSQFKFNQQDIDYLISQNKKQQSQYQQKIKSLQFKLNQQINNQKQLNRKIHFLQKLIIQKQNQTHHSHKKNKLVQRQKIKLLKQITSLQSQLSQIQSKHQIQISQFKQKNDRQALMQKSMFEKLIKQKNNHILKLQKQIAYLSTLLSYWKPLDELDRIDKLQQNSSHKQKTISLHSINNNQSFNLLQHNQNRQNSRSKTPMLFQYPDEANLSHQQKILLKNSYRQDQDLLSAKESAYLTISNRQLQESPSQKLLGNNFSNRPHKSNKKWNNEAIKCRKVDYSQIQNLGQLIRYKMIAQNKTIKQVKQYFSHKLSKSTTNKFQQELITMKQVKQILMSQPFSLAENQAFTLSRYIIQDQGVQYVYCHEGNQLERQIVKSIIKTIIGQYSLPDSVKAQQKWQHIKKIYSHNMQLALKSICPKGTVTKNKLLQLMNSLGIQTDQQIRSYLIGKLVLQSNSLQALKYDILFDPQERIQ